MNLQSPEGLAALMLVPGVGSARALKLAQFKTWDALQGVDPAVVRALVKVALPSILPVPDPLPAGVRRISWFDADFPIALKRIPAPPAVLYVRGTFPPRLAAAVVGTRAPSAWGLGATRALTRALVEAGVAVVSGLALGVDAAAHAAALDAGGATWAVLGSGVDVPTPSANAKLSERILASGGGLLSEQVPGTLPSAASLMTRNRLQSGLSVATIIAECGLLSGTMATAAHALNQERLLFVAAPPSGPVPLGNAALLDPEVSVRTLPQALERSARRGLPLTRNAVRSRSDVAAMVERILLAAEPAEPDATGTLF